MRSAVAYLQPLINAENATLPLELLVSEKKAADKNKARYEQLVGAIKSSHAGVRSRAAPPRRRRSSRYSDAAPAQAVVACLMKEKPVGEFATLWKKELEEEASLEQAAPGPPVRRQH